MDPINYIYLITPAIAAILSAVLVGVVTYYANKNLENHKAEINNRQEKQKVYGLLMGRKQYLEQIYVAFYEARIRHECYLAAFNFAKSRDAEMYKTPQEIEAHLGDSIELKEGIRARKRVEELQTELGRANERLWETIGLTQALFYETNTINIDKQIDLIKEITDKFNSFNLDLVNNPPEGDGTKIRSWGIERTKELKEIVKKSIREPIDELMIYLETEIKNSR